MSLPPRAFYSLTEVSIRWGCVIADIAGWAATGHLTLVTSIASVICGKQPVAGIVVISAEDMMRMFRRHWKQAQTIPLNREFSQGSNKVIPSSGNQVQELKSIGLIVPRFGLCQ